MNIYLKMICLCFVLNCSENTLNNRFSLTKNYKAQGESASLGAVLSANNMDRSNRPGLRGTFFGYDGNLIANEADYAHGSHFFLSWKSGGDFDRLLNQLAPDKKAILRLVITCGTKNEDCAPSEYLSNSTYTPVVVNNSCGASNRRLDYLNPQIIQALKQTISNLGRKYADDDRVLGLEIGIGFAGESVPWSQTNVSCDKAQQEEAYRNHRGKIYSEKNWANYHNDIVDAYISAFSDSSGDLKKNLITIVASAFAENYRGQVVEHAVSKGVGLLATDLTNDFYNRRGLSASCWGPILDKNFSNLNDQAAFRTSWAPLLFNSSKVTIGYELNNLYDISSLVGNYLNNEAHTWWLMLNGLDKHADYILPFNDKIAADGSVQPGNSRYREVWEFYNRFAGKSAKESNSAFIAFRGPRYTHGQTSANGKDLGWCPDIYDYSWYITSEIEDLPYNPSASAFVNKIDRETVVFNVGTSGDWRGAFARKTSLNMRTINLKINPEFLAPYRDLSSEPLQVKMRLTYLDGAKGNRFSIYYDSTSGKKLGLTVEQQGSYQFKTAELELTDAAFNQSLANIFMDNVEGGYDIALEDVDSIDDTFHMLEIIPRKVDKQEDDVVILPPINPQADPGSDTAALSVGDEDYLYVAKGLSGMSVYRKNSDDEKFEFISNFNTEGFTHALVYSNDTVFLSDHFQGIKALDVHQPDNPILLQSLDTNEANGLILSNDFLFLADHHEGIKIFDVHDPSHMTLISRLDTPGEARNLDLNAHYLLVADGSAGLIIIDVKDVYSPRLLAVIPTPGEAYDVKHLKNTAYLACKSGGLVGVDISAPNQPVLLFSKFSGQDYDVVALDLFNNLIATAELAGGVNLYQITQSPLPEMFRHFTSSEVVQVKIMESKILVSDWTQGVKTFSYTPPVKKMPSFHTGGDFMEKPQIKEKPPTVK